MRTVTSWFRLLGPLTVALCALRTHAQTNYTPYTFTTLAAQRGVQGSADGTNGDARFYGPNSVAVDTLGNVYVADKNNNTIRKVTPNGIVTTLAGLAGVGGSVDGTGSDARFSGPAGVAVDASGNVYVATRHSIRKVSAAGVVTTFAGSTFPGSADFPPQFFQPSGLAVDSSGNIYVADSLNHTVRKITPGGSVITLAGLAGNRGSVDGTGTSARFGELTGVAVDGAGTVYVADRDNQTIRKVTKTGVVTTLAGLAGSVGNTDGTTNNARFNAPNNLALDGATNVYVADSHNHVIRKITPAGVVTTLIGQPGVNGHADGTNDDAHFSTPNSVAVDGGGNLYVADLGNDAIRKVTPEGVVTTLAGLASDSATTGINLRFDTVLGAAVDTQGNIYLADSRNQVIRKVTPTGLVSTLAGLPGVPGSADGTNSSARFQGPVGVAVNQVGNVYVGDEGNRTIRKITPAGVVTTLAGLAGAAGSADGTNTTARFRSPDGVAVDDSGNVYVADSGNQNIRKVTSAGVVTTLAGLALSSGSADGTNSTARFRSPVGLSLDPEGTIYVADSGNHTIRKVTPLGVVTTLAGTAGSFGSNDGTNSTARFFAPVGVAVDRGGNVYVADANNHTIRGITSEGVVTTLAGWPGSVGSGDGTGSAARFYSPSVITADRAGNVYVVDRFNDALRRGFPADGPPGIATSDSGFGFGGGQFGFNLAGPAGRTVVIDASSDLANWSPIWTNAFGAGALYFNDPQTGSHSNQFYRAYLP